ncbi:extensin family protein [Brevundimonas sp. A19_0]|uniref:extensin-like domain-containing protein n=1 Tax=Brevundimonas sp. A19_0 TaxID=2821087 RepID=UPI001ADD37FF|nr:extensin family protein [Brevundimonas sp. A19_0]MBO9500988.1 extensin family protein [Brevundimonas sp. A19_0]
MKRDLADFWNLLWEAALGLCAAFAMLNLFAPPQDLPWKPLDLDRPIGQATAAKVDDFEISRLASQEEVRGVTEACMQVLRDAGVEVERAPDRDDGGFCVVRGAVRITGGDVTPLRPGGLVMQCPLAVRYVIWDRQVLRPAARETFGSEVASVENYGSYSCRRIYGKDDPSARPSEHARANALDVSGVRLEDGRVVSVASDWDGRGRSGSEGRGFLKRLRDGACRVFSTVLTPDYNEAHADHLHLDGAPRGLCA